MPVACRRCLPHAGALLLYVVVAVAFSWPLPAQLSSHLTGPIDSDAGVYVWNQWVFRHELVENRSLPYFTGTIFSLTPKANLSLHNYTTFANLLALPLMPHLGVVATFNVVYLALTVLTAYAMFLLARDLTNGAEVESWLAGMLFAWCPVLVTRGAGHFSLVAAAPLPIFVLLLLRTHHAWRLSHGVALGLAMAWAATSDAYYGVFCLLVAAVVLGAAALRLRRAEGTTRSAALLRAIDVLIVLMLGLVTAILISRGWRVTFLGRAVSFRSLYTPVLVVTLLILIRGALVYRPSFTRLDAGVILRFFRFSTVTAVVCAVVLSPVLFALGQRIADGRLGNMSRVLWRSSPPGVDLLALILPNPNHPLAPEVLRAWLSARPNGYLENVASTPWVALGVILLACAGGWRIPRVWAVLAGGFALLALGPFVQIAGLNTYVPGPWALLRYVPIVGLTRSPARYAVILALAVAALFALAVTWLAARYPHRRRAIIAAAGILLAAELMPAPRPMHAAGVPGFYRRIAADPRPDVRVLELPFGVRDGTRSVGNFTARSQFYQTFHGKPLIGGYLSRVSRKRVEEIRRYPMLDALITLSEGRSISEETMGALEERAAGFVDRAQVGYVVIDRARAPRRLVEFALRAFRLELLERDGSLELYRPLI